MIGAITYDGLAPPTNTSATLNSAGSGLERATIRFRLAPDPSDLRISLVKKPEEKK
jgi:hypothetical protein